MIKVGVITILKIGNYGAELQAYATVAVLQSLGTCAEIIDYLFYKHPDFKKTRMSRPMCPMPMLKRLKEHLFPFVEFCRLLLSGGSRRGRLRVFEDFHRKNTPMSHTFRTMEELYASAVTYDCYVAGSDQIWNPGIFASLRPYLLDFAKPSALRISYASSVGTKSIPEALKPFFADALKKMKAVSVREAAGAELLKKNFGCEAKVVLDPTLLLPQEEWAKIEEKCELPAHFIFVYSVSESPKLAHAAKELAKAENLPVIRLSIAPTESSEKSFRDVSGISPAQFLYVMRCADFVLTNSFHGTAFSIIYQKQFVCLLDARKDNNCRQVDLLRKLGISERGVDSQEWHCGLMALPIDYVAVHARLSGLREDSIAFLKENIL